MVELHRMPSFGHTDALNIMSISSMLANTTLGFIQEDPNRTTTEKGKTVKNDGGVYQPRRAFTTFNYQLPKSASASRLAQTAHLLPTPSPSPLETDRDSYFQSSLSTTQQRQHQGAAIVLAPQRSWSLIDYEPVPFTQQPGTVLTLSHLPPELHYAVFDFLDPIDSVCLALTSRHFYVIHRRMHGRVSLASRREGPNDMEWVWRNAGPFLSIINGNDSGRAVGKQNSLALLSPRGQVYCRKCRTERCALHKHIREWMGGSRVEYCAVTERFGTPAPEGASSYCFRSSPRHPHRCGRHTKNQRAVRLV
ncbi:hypothetical protein F5Y16DRAFT_200682 [Xylariaceae sp. FL0255]|nr:hypothetical protein F5Y16DRAFT_200682 [Xylariaceae sp. FL0255]